MRDPISNRHGNAADRWSHEETVTREAIRPTGTPIIENLSVKLIIAALTKAIDYLKPDPDLKAMRNAVREHRDRLNKDSWERNNEQRAIDRHDNNETRGWKDA